VEKMFNNLSTIV